MWSLGLAIEVIADYTIPRGLYVMLKSTSASTIENILKGLLRILFIVDHLSKIHIF